MMASHFEKERQTVGLHGLYTKYKDYTDCIAKLLLLLGRLLITLQLREDGGSHADARKFYYYVIPSASTPFLDRKKWMNDRMLCL